VNLPYLDAKTTSKCVPISCSAKKLGKLLCQLAPPQVDRLHVHLRRKAQELPNIDPITRRLLMGFLSRSSVKDLNNDNGGASLRLSHHGRRKTFERAVTSMNGCTPVFRGQEKVASAGGTSLGHGTIRASFGYSASRPKLCLQRGLMLNNKIGRASLATLDPDGAGQVILPA